ncbi:MAG: response regulator transcription factor [Flavobacteriales bacterium]|nr:response regulator transcription factor [Flavobacteriales bacterium]MCX7767798.1 response regulator transcription factor [Flavobacteriales bacterium]MDW8409801.1 response regulator transcription factor [Flavobacteriales bacterium]
MERSNSTIYRLLLVEDEENIGHIVTDFLTNKGYDVTWAKDGREGSDLALYNTFDLCILDVMLPFKNGFDLAREIRKAHPDMPIIFLTAKNMPENKMEGFELGADDYISKPFLMDELAARINAVLRRVHQASKPPSAKVFKIGKYEFDPITQELRLGENKRKLTAKESELLRLLCQNMNRVLERNFALRNIWREDSYFNARSMDVYITKLRKYLSEDPSVALLNVHGKGFKLVVPEVETEEAS